MCRHIAYLGAPVTLHSLVYEPPHSLEHQSYAPKLNLFNKLNLNGTCSGWNGIQCDVLQPHFGQIGGPGGGALGSRTIEMQARFSF